jgi:hypothetical protein
VFVSRTRRHKTRTVIVLFVVAIAVVAIAAFLVGPRLTGDTTSSASADGTGGAGGTGGAAPAEGAAATSSAPYTIKPEPTEVATDSPVEQTGGKVDVALTFAGFDGSTGTVQANGFVAGVLEDGGTCTLTLTKGSENVTATSTGAADASTTSCGLLETSAGIAAGTWHAVLSYSSDDAHGTSQSTEVVVG